jgi:hypothetical protein
MLRCRCRIPAPPHHTQSQLGTTWAGICSETSTCEVISHTHPVTPQQAGGHLFAPTLHHSCSGLFWSSEDVFIFRCLLTPHVSALPPSDQLKANPFHFNQQPTHKQSQISTCLAFSETTRTSRRVASLTVLLVSPKPVLAVSSQSPFKLPHPPVTD